MIGRAAGEAAVAAKKTGGRQARQASASTSPECAVKEAMATEAAAGGWRHDTLALGAFGGASARVQPHD